MLCVVFSTFFPCAFCSVCKNANKKKEKCLLRNTAHLWMEMKKAQKVGIKLLTPSRRVFKKKKFLLQRNQSGVTSYCQPSRSCCCHCCCLPDCDVHRNDTAVSSMQAAADILLTRVKEPAHADSDVIKDSRNLVGQRECKTCRESINQMEKKKQLITFFIPDWTNKQTPHISSHWLN